MKNAMFTAQVLSLLAMLPIAVLLQINHAADKIKPNQAVVMQMQQTSHAIQFDFTPLLQTSK